MTEEEFVHFKDLVKEHNYAVIAREAMETFDDEWVAHGSHPSREVSDWTKAMFWLLAVPMFVVLFYGGIYWAALS